MNHSPGADRQPGNNVNQVEEMETQDGVFDLNLLRYFSKFEFESLFVNMHYIIILVDTVDTLTDTGGDITDRDVNGEMMIGPQNQDLTCEVNEVDY